MPNFPRVLRPQQRFDATLAGELANVLAAAIEVLQNWDLRVAATGRLRRAEAHLRAVALRGEIGNEPSNLIRTARAARLAVDFYHIATALNDVRDDSIARELVVALGGTLEADSKDTSAYEIQSQYWVGVVLAQSGLRPTVPSGSGQLPDFAVTVNDLSLGVEVKRPRSVKAAKPVLSKAADQLSAFGRPGMIVIDLSAALGANSLIVPEDGMAPAKQVLQQRLNRVGDSLRDYVYTYDRSPKFKRILSMLVFARYWVWSSVDPLVSDVGIIFTSIIFPKACSGILIEYAKRLEGMVLNGIEEITGNPVKTRRV